MHQRTNPIAVFFSVSIHFVPVLEPNIDMTIFDNFPTAVYLKFGIRMIRNKRKSCEHSKSQKTSETQPHIFHFHKN